MSGAPRIIWSPDAHAMERSQMARFLAWLRDRGVDAGDYWAAWRWSVADVPGFWAALWDHFEVRGTRTETVLTGSAMPDVRWFPGATLNMAEHLLQGRPERTAVIAATEEGEDRRLTYGQLAGRVGAFQEGLRARGLARGDVVVALMPNSVDTLVAFLACAGLGITWSCCSPEFGLRAVVDRFAQLRPRLLLAVPGYTYGGRTYDKRDDVERLRAALPTLEGVAVVGTTEREAFTGPPVAPEFVPVPFEEPLWVLYSSGTTGLPKGIVHSHGGILLESLKQTRLHMDLGVDDRFFWYTTTGWMMWNVVAGALLSGGTIVLYDGSLAAPDLGVLWRLAERAQITFMGISAGFVQASLKAGRVPREEVNLSALRAVGVTGSPLTGEGYDWLAGAVKEGIPICSMSGGTDVCSSFLCSSPLLPIHRGELSAPALGVSAMAYDAEGRPVVGEVGELVITQPMPSMPLRLWNDRDGSLYRATYFATYPGVWRHGDWVTFTERGSAVIHGRSDATLNRGGVRMGTSELYRVVEALPEIADSLVVDVGANPTTSRLLLFVVPAAGVAVDDRVVRTVRDAIRRDLSPRHVPDEVVAIDAVPRTLNGKKLEVPVKRLLEGVDLDRAVSTGSVANPEALRVFAEWATRGAAATSQSEC